MRFLGRSLTGLFLLAATLGLLAYAGGLLRGAVEERMNREVRQRPGQETVIAVNTAEIVPEVIAPTLTAFGNVQSRRTLQIRASLAGRIVELADNFEDGATVEEGELLARIDPLDAETALDNARTDLAEAEAELREAERAVEITRDERAAAEAQAELRQAALQRQQDLQDRGIGTAAAVEEAALAESSARQSILTRRQSEADGEARVETARNALSRARLALAAAERALEDTEIRATFTGTLADVAVVEGGLVTANEQIATLIDPDALEVAFRISTAQYARLLDEEGGLRDAEVRVTLDVLGLGLEAQGRLSRVSAAVGEGVTGRLLFARLSEFAGFRPGDFVTVHVKEPALEDVSRLPSTAVASDDTVLVLDEEERLVLAAVELLRRQGDDVIVSAPDLAGLRVVAERTPLVGPGIKVRDLTAEREAAGETPAAEDVASRGTGSAEPGADEGTIPLTPERRAALIAAVEDMGAMPEAARARVLAQLQQESVPASVVARIEARTGG
ncbi:HlyD family efflux transporter periplasmic adaptor subunit [Roseicyclus sp. F158]|uniref:HlyD family efflux transporter periplasmic adaptor subunit n=1 Tax=Tropicimonas omnivorans TaxID=3075590 RepID=A0ABU3DC71_9RHOB|nr:HlyD family efflux transporter periplasmic adaptor subunit [Roseicyclus sp. F158]MDT0681310.1 HlyD family efflux transporter periplasmic adaptor subunit [Roseicyclus sp. F158]